MALERLDITATPNFIGKSPVRTLLEDRFVSNEIIGRRIAQGGKTYFKIIDELKGDPSFNLEKEIERVRRKYEGYFETPLERDANFPTSKDWRMLAVIELYDETTALHSVETYTIARDKISHPLFGTFRLEDAFNKETISLEQFLRATLFHDVGKVDVPHEVVGNHIQDIECASLLLEHESVRDEYFKRYLPEVKEYPNFASAEELLQFIYKQGRRPQMMTPLYLLMHDSSEQEIFNVNVQLSRLSGELNLEPPLTVNNTLMEIMRVHSKLSRNILAASGFPVEGTLAGEHHYRGNNPLRYTFSVGALQVSVNFSDIIHMADVRNAIQSPRQYKKGDTWLSALHQLADQAEHGLLPKDISYIWIADDYEQLKIRNLLPASGLDSKEQKHLDAVMAFLNKTQEELKDKGLDKPPFSLFHGTQ